MSSKKQDLVADDENGVCARRSASSKRLIASPAVCGCVESETCALGISVRSRERPRRERDEAVRERDGEPVRRKGESVRPTWAAREWSSSPRLAPASPRLTLAPVRPALAPEHSTHASRPTQPQLAPPRRRAQRPQAEPPARRSHRQSPNLARPTPAQGPRPAPPDAHQGHDHLETRPRSAPSPLSLARPSSPELASRPHAFSGSHRSCDGARSLSGRSGGLAEGSRRALERRRAARSQVGRGRRLTSGTGGASGLSAGEARWRCSRGRDSGAALSCRMDEWRRALAGRCTLSRPRRSWMLTDSVASSSLFPLVRPRRLQLALFSHPLSNPPTDLVVEHPPPQPLPLSRPPPPSPPPLSPPLDLSEPAPPTSRHQPAHHHHPRPLPSTDYLPRRRTPCRPAHPLSPTNKQNPPARPPRRRITPTPPSSPHRPTLPHPR